MEEAAERLEFERAAQIRDQLAALKRIQAQQIVTAEGERDVDVFAIVGEAGEYGVSVMLVRGGRNLGTTSYFPRAALAEADEALSSFVMQYYAAAEPPPEVLLGSRLEDAAALGAGAQPSAPRHPVSVRHPVRGLGAALGRADARERGAGAAHALRAAPGHGRDARRPGARARSARAARAHRVLRHQPHRRGGHGRLLRGVRSRGAAEEGVPALQHHGRHARG